MPDANEPAAAIVKLGERRLLVVEVGTTEDVPEWRLDFSLRPAIGGGADDICTNLSICSNQGAGCSGLKVK